MLAYFPPASISHFHSISQDGDTALIGAVKGGAIEVVTALLDKGANTDAINHVRSVS